MKRILTLLLFATSSLIVHGQEEWCGSMEMLEAFHDAHPDLEAAYEADQQAMFNTRTNFRKSNHKTIIPVVIHVIHYNGLGNISRAQIDDGMRILNEDFNKLNADTSIIRPVFQSLSKSMDIEFRLARKDPNGNCTEGINRVNSHLAMGPANRNAPKALVQWDPNRYLNVWIVYAFNSPTLGGFAQFPSPNAGPNNTYGFIVKADEWGAIGTATNGAFGGRAVPHEVGHCFELFHPFQGGCPASFQSCQNSGDGVCDVPPQANSLNNQCLSSANTCAGDDRGGVVGNTNPFNSNVPDMIENIMGYGIGCQVMFTEGQKNRMERAFGRYTKLINLTDTANATATGTNDGYLPPVCSPIAEILEFDRFVCRGGSLTFTDDSYGGPLSTYSWSFPGGTPSTSSQPQPTITYNTAGTYDVVLRVSNSAGVDSVVLQDYVHVDDSIASHSGFNYVESFENASRFDSEWITISPSPGTAWDRAAFAGKTGSSSAWLNNFNNIYVGGKEQLISPSIDMNDVLNPSISVEVAYRRKDANSDDKLNFYASLDCGNSWITILSTTPAFFAYDNSTQNSNFVPTQGTQWKNVTIPSGFIPTSVKSSDRVRFRFEVVHGAGNNFYLDDFKILGQPTSIGENQAKASNELLIYPNPSEDRINVRFEPTKSGQSHIYLSNTVGEKVMEVFNGNMLEQQYRFSIDGKQLSKGVYFLSIESNGERITEKIVIR